MALGNSSASALISGARAARNRQTAVNDQYQAYDYANSAQTEQDYNAYSSYLNNRLSTTTDPGKKITIQSKLQSANSSFTSNEIQRQTQSVMTGESSNEAKLAKIHDLWTRAAQSGNENLAQNLASQYISLTKTIQSEGQAATAKAEASANKQMGANKDQYDFVHQALEAQLNIMEDDVRHGRASSTDLQKFRASYNQQKESIMQDALQGKYGPLSDSSLGTISSEHNKLVHGADYQKAIAEGGVYKDKNGKETANPNTYMKWNLVNGQWFATPVDRDSGATSGTKDTMVQTADGTWVKQYGNKWQGMNADDRKKAAAGGSFQYITNDGTSGHAGNNGYTVQIDENGNAFYIDPRPGANQNKKRYLSLDPNAKVQESDNAAEVSGVAGRQGRDWHTGDYFNAIGDAMSGKDHGDLLKTTEDALMTGGNKIASFAGQLGHINPVLGMGANIMDAVNGHVQQEKSQRLLQAQQAIVAQQHAAEINALKAKTVGTTIAGAPGVPAALQPTPQQKAASYVKTMNTAPAPGQLPVVNMINQAFGTAKAPAPAPAAPKPTKPWWKLW